MNNTIVKSEDLLYIEKCIGAIKNKDDVAGNLKKIERSLQRITDYEFSIMVTKNTTNTFFGANLYPDESVIDAIVDQIVHKTSDSGTVTTLWQQNKKWTIELDSILLYDAKLNANPAEIVAVILHELGHVVYSNTVPQRINKILRYKFIKINYQMRELITNAKIRKLFNLSVIEACGNKNFSYINNMKTEKVADQFVVKMGYANELNSFITKLIAVNGNGMVNRTDAEIEKDITSIVNWTVLNIQQLEFRKDKLRDALKVEMRTSPSRYVKNSVKNIYYSFFGKTTDTYREMLSEQYGYEPVDKYSALLAEQLLMDEYHRVLKESLSSIFERNGKVKKISQSDIDILLVEVDRISTVDDKIYLLDRLYDKMELIDISLDLIAQGKSSQVQQSKTTLLNMKNQLQDMRDEIMAMKIVDRDYGVFVKYPKGYKG